MRTHGLTFAALVAAGLAAVGGCVDAPEAEKVPITTSSDEARQMYVEGRRLQDNVRTAAAREHYLRAIARDDSFALAHLDLASVAVNGKEFFESVARAVALADQVSRGEREMILAFNAGVNGRPAEQFQHISKLVELYPGDERARRALGGWYFGREEWEAAIEQYRRAVELDPEAASTYNQLGYCYRNLERWDDAESAFKKYIEYLPNEPNPYDSYAEMLMKQGRFQESIENYERALALDPTFAPSYRGIGTNYVFMGQFDKGRETYQRLFQIAKNEGQKRAALLWTAAAYVHEGHTDEALEVLERRYGIAKDAGDKVNQAGDLATMGVVLLEAGRPEAARTKLDASLEMTDAADVPDQVKRSAHRQYEYFRARLLLEEGDVEGAEAALAKYREAVQERRIPSDLNNLEYLNALVAEERGRYEEALAAIERAKEHGPRFMLLRAQVLREMGKLEAAHEAFERVASYNGLGVEYAFYRKRATELVAQTLPE